MKNKKLTDQQLKILRSGDTEEPGTGKWLYNKQAGNYYCGFCHNLLFNSTTKFDSKSGWPSFYEVANNNAVKLSIDDSHNMTRTEVRCSKCDSHLGHLFNDAFDQPINQRYCINSSALDFEKE